jgi:hypothetical protein
MAFTGDHIQRFVEERRALRATLTRRRFLGLTAGSVAAFAVLPGQRPAWANPSDPKPIPGGLAPFHAWGPQYKPGGPPDVYEQSTIGDFSGGIASTDVTGWGVDQTGREMYFRCDMRAQQGLYVAQDGQTYEGSFAFI